MPIKGLNFTIRNIRVIECKEVILILESSRPIAACANGHRTVTPEVTSAHVSDYFVCISFEEKNYSFYPADIYVLQRCHSSCTNWNYASQENINKIKTTK